MMIAHDTTHVSDVTTTYGKTALLSSEEIEVILEVKGGTPIKQDTVAILESQGITGLKYIDLVGGTKNSPLLKTKIIQYLQ